jgi:HPt (histidine-containing phosphotransfer) domain-containing protein
VGCGCIEFGLPAASRFYLLGIWLGTGVKIASTSPLRILPIKRFALYGIAIFLRYVLQEGGDEALLSELVIVFQQDLPGYLDGVKTAIEQNDNEGIARTAHILKGPLGTLGFVTAGALALDLEVMGRTNNIGEASTCFGTLSKELAKLEPLLIKLSGDKSLATDSD